MNVGFLMFPANNTFSSAYQNISDRERLFLRGHCHRNRSWKVKLMEALDPRNIFGFVESNLVKTILCKNPNVNGKLFYGKKTFYESRFV